MRAALTAPASVYSLSVSGDRLLTGGPDGKAQLFKVDAREGVRPTIEHLRELTVGTSDLEDLRLSPPGMMVRSVRLNCVDFASESAGPGAAPATKFLAAQGRKLILVDVQEGGRKTADQAIGNDALYSATWSPHGGLISTGGVDRTLSVVDSRMMGDGAGNAVIWKVENAHAKAITCTAISPFIPHWLASSGEDGAVQVWDLRYASRPTARINSYYHSIPSFAWSNSHCEVLATGSAGSAWQAWMLKEDIHTLRTPGPEMFFGSPGWESTVDQKGNNDTVSGGTVVGEWKGDWKGPIISVRASPTHLNTFYVLSAIGEIATHKIEPNAMEPHAIHRFPRESPEYEIENNLYTRDIPSALQNVTTLSKSARLSGSIIAPTEKEMIDLVTPLPAIEETEWSLATALPTKNGTKPAESSEEVSQKFKKEVATWRWYLPPGMAKMKAWSDVIPNQVQLEFDLVVFRFNLLVDVLAGNWEQVVKAEKMITKGMNTDPTFMDATALKMLLESVIPNDQLKALQLGQKFCEIVADTPSRQFNSMSSIVGVLLFPTIFDAERWLPESGFEVGGKAAESNKPPSDENLASPTSPTTTSEFQPAAALTRRQTIVKEWIERKRHAVGGVAPNREEALKRLKAIGAKEKNGENKAGGPNVTAAGDEKRVQALKAVVEDTKKCLDMVQLDIRIHKAITNAQRSADGATAAASSDFAGEEIVRLVHAFEISDSLMSMNPQKGGGKVRRTISAYTNRMFLDALLASAAFDEYFAVAVELSVTYYSFPFGRTLLRQMTREALPRIKSFTDTLYSQAIAQITQSLPTDASATLAPTTIQNLMSGVRILKDALYKVIRATLGIANGLSVASGKDTNVDKSAVEGVKKVVEGMTQHLGNLSADLFKTLQTIDRVSAGSNRPAKEAAQLVFDPIKELTRQSVQFLDTTSQNSATIIHDVVNETNSMLEKLNKIIKDNPSVGGGASGAGL